MSSPRSTLVDAAELRALLEGEAAAGVLLLDCRHRLGDPEAGRTLYRDGHLPGAIFADLGRDLAGEPGPDADGHGGRHPLPPIEAWLDTLGSWGLHPATQAVVYDDVGGAFASRLWWMLRAVGHRAGCLLDGGIDAWTASGGRLERGEPTLPRPESPYPGKLDDGMLASWTEVRSAAAGDARLLLLDAREPARFRGEEEPIDPIAGHIPQAVNAPFQDNLRDGRFLPPAALRARFDELLAGRPASEVVSYCGSGVTACHNLLAMEIAGLEGARLFPPSWSGWCRTGLPVATGD